MTEPRPDPAPIMQLATGYWNSAAFLAANDLNLFGVLGEGPKTAAQAAERLKADSRATALLMDACAGLGLLSKEGAGEEAAYRNAPAADAFLVPDRPGYLGGAIRWGAGQYAAWGRLAEAVQEGEPVAPPAQHLGDDPERTRAFVLGMHSRALGMARGLIHFLDMAGARSLLDVGGGPGTYAALLAQKYPALRATVLDLPPIVAIAEELLAEAGVADRVRVRPGNAVTDDYGEAEFDAVLFSGVLHQMSPPTIRRMLGRARRALQPGGRVFISDIMLDEDKTQPPFATLFSLQMLLTSAEGAVFAAEECRAWLTEAGFAQIAVQPLPPPMPYTLITASA